MAGLTEGSLDMYEIRRNLQLELKLQVQKAKLTKLTVEVERFLGDFRNTQIKSEDLKTSAERLEEICNELQNMASNLHG